MMMKMMKMMKMNQICSTVPYGEELLPEDLILEIFTNLSPISLLRFKSLSKTFHYLISNPDFLRRYTVHQFRRRLEPFPPIPHIIFKHGHELSANSKIIMISPSSGLDVDEPRYYSQLLQNLIDYRPEHNQPHDDNDQKVKKFTVIDSCNGLLLYLNCDIYLNCDNPPAWKYIWYVCNPITKDYIKLPPLEEQEFKILRSANLVFDPLLSLTYKVVIWIGEYAAWRLYVYSSETRAWRLSFKTNINDFHFGLPQEQFNHFDFRAVLLNGVLYWSTLLPINMDVSLCYDIEKNSVWTLKFPKMPVGYVRRQLLYFGVCDGGLRLIEKYYEQWSEERAFPSSFDVMEMNQLQLQQQHQDRNIIDRDLWTVKYRVNIMEGYSPNPVRRNPMLGVYILDLYKTTTKADGEGEEVLLLCRINHNGRLVFSFNLSRNTFGKELLQHNERLDRDHFSSFADVLLYTNITLFPLHSLD